MELYQLNNGQEIPKVGFGTWKIADGEPAYRSVLHALETGYRHIDTAQIYGNELSVGKAIQDSPVPRQEIFLTTKIWNDHTDQQKASDSIKASMDKLKVDYIDLVLIHWPNPYAIRKEDPQAWIDRNRQVWQAMEEAVKAGLIRSIGVSNFMAHHLESLMEHCEIKPAVNQIKLAPGLTQDEVVDYCRQHQIVVEAYSPLGHGTAFKHPDIIEMASRYPGKSPAQVALRWSLDKGYLPLPKSETPANIEANLDIFDFKLSEEDIEILNQLTDVTDPVDPDVQEF